MRLRTVLAAIGLVLSLAGIIRAAGKPNFVFIYTDDQRWDAMSCVQKEQGDKARFPWFQTPNMDRIAAEGVRFRNAFVTMSLCAPSRTAFLTGRYNHCNGVHNNHTPYPLDNVSHASVLRQHGYTTGYVGKWHMGSQSGQRPGFDFSASFIGQGKYFDCPVEVNGKSTPTKGWIDDVSTDYAIDFIRKNKDRPFDLVIGYKATHGPWEGPPRVKNLYANDEPRPVPNLTVPAVYHDGGKGGAGGKNFEQLRNYMRCVKAADDNVGKVLAVLDELGIAGNTVVVFASDNGYYNGEHQLGDKRSAYDESLRIPMLLRYPKLAPKGKVMDEMVLNIDLAPTLLDLAGVPVPATMQGKSWKPLLEGKTDGWRHAWFYEYFKEGNFSTPTILAVRTDTAKLVKYPGHDEWTELFDLKNDPYELKNLVKDPGAKDLLAQMQSEYDRQAKAVDFKMPPPDDKPDKPGKKGGGGKKDKAGPEENG